MHNLQGQFVGRNDFVSDIKTCKEFISLNSAGIEFQITDPKELIEFLSSKTVLILWTISSDLEQRLQLWLILTKEFAKVSSW